MPGPPIERASMPAMRRGQDVRTDRHAGLSSEWLLGNGLGGSASGTLGGSCTRTAHSYLTASGSHGRLTTLLLGLEERLLGNEGTYTLSTTPGVRASPGAEGRGDLEGCRLC